MEDVVGLAAAGEGRGVIHVFLGNGIKVKTADIAIRRVSSHIFIIFIDCTTRIFNHISKYIVLSRQIGGVDHKDLQGGIDFLHIIVNYFRAS